jgi:hypothetical protein
MHHSYFQTRFLHIIWAQSSIILVAQNILLNQNQIKFQILQCNVFNEWQSSSEGIYIYTFLVYFIMLLAIVESITICNLLVHWYLLAFLYNNKKNLSDSKTFMFSNYHPLIKMNAKLNGIIRVTPRYNHCSIFHCNNEI